MFQELGKVPPEFIYKSIEIVINSHCGGVEAFMSFLALANKFRTLKTNFSFFLAPYKMIIRKAFLVITQKVVGRSKKNEILVFYIT